MTVLKLITAEDRTSPCLASLLDLMDFKIARYVHDVMVLIVVYMSCCYCYLCWCIFFCENWSLHFPVRIYHKPFQSQLLHFDDSGFV